MAEETTYNDLNEHVDKVKIIKHLEIQLQDLELKGEHTLEAESVYGAVIAIPQIARCMDWNPTMTALAYRAVLMLFINYLLQGSAIMFIGEESHVMDRLGGKMHLCDFAKNLENCPEGNACLGPGGENYTASGLYSYDIWNVRKWMRDSLKSVIDVTDGLEGGDEQVNTLFDPGEYGMENYYCRMLACFIFMMAEACEIFKIAELIVVLVKTPNQAGSWVYSADSDETLQSPLDNLKFKTAGMPIHWKIINFILVIFPKCFLLYNVAWMGFFFLMSTAGIVDLVLGAMTMDFVLTLDELIFAALASSSSKHIMNELEGYVYDETDQHDYIENELSGGKKGFWGATKLLIPMRLVVTCLMMVGFLFRYYLTHCDWKDGGWVSKDMFAPTTTKYSFWNFVSGFVPVADTPYWTMPPEPKT